MNKYFHIFLLITPFIVFGIWACRTEVPHDFPSFDKKPVINAVFTADSAMWVHLSFAQSMGNDPISTIANARVYVFANNVCIDTLLHRGQGMYASDSLVHAGTLYTIRVAVPGYDTIFATQLVPIPSQIVRSTFIPLVSRNEEGHVSGFDITIKTKPQEFSYYMILCYGYSYGYYRKIGTFFSEDDPSFISEGIPADVISNKLFVDDSSFTVRLVYQQGRYYDQFQLYQIQLHTLSKDFYTYMRSSYLYEQSRYPEFSFGGITPYNLYSNTSNTYGVFLSSAVTMTDTTRIYNNLSPFNSY